MTSRNWLSENLGKDNLKYLKGVFGNTDSDKEKATEVSLLEVISNDRDISKMVSPTEDDNKRYEDMIERLGKEVSPYSIFDSQRKVSGMHVIVGLGNPHDSFRETRHNAGFMVLDQLSTHYFATDWIDTLHSKVALISIEGNLALMVKPQTYMNDSGMALLEISKMVGGIDPKNLIVVHDDMDIPACDCRVSKDSRSAGHRGVKSIIDDLGTKDFTRIRIGIGKNFGADTGVLDYVLSVPEGIELADFHIAINHAEEAIIEIMKKVSEE